MNRDAMAADAAAATFGSKVTAGGAATTIGGWLLSSEFGVLIGILMGVIGLLVNLYFQHRRDQREERIARLEEIEHQRRMAQMASRPGDLHE